MSAMAAPSMIASAPSKRSSVTDVMIDRAIVHGQFARGVQF
ncbi:MULTISPECIES: hypothetical protein [Bradyrhizobium]|jgi:hypothetical protein|nr:MULTISPECIES: hypothetical protein [unclassified Bradyrhizobium]